ncbi:hypothetical protein Avbf_00927 [Armadillidium vulgare]|nr:hypothetical protein Avbf_00927 [Armadillidium vulgare]
MVWGQTNGYMTTSFPPIRYGYAQVIGLFLKIVCRRKYSRMENRDLLTDVRLIRKENEILKITKLLDTNETLKDSNIGVKGLILLNNSQSSTDLNGTE